MLAYSCLDSTVRKLPHWMQKFRVESLSKSLNLFSLVLLVKISSWLGSYSICNYLKIHKNKRYSPSVYILRTVYIQSWRRHQQQQAISAVYLLGQLPYPDVSGLRCSLCSPKRLLYTPETINDSESFRYVLFTQIRSQRDVMYWIEYWRYTMEIGSGVSPYTNIITLFFQDSRNFYMWVWPKISYW